MEEVQQSLRQCRQLLHQQCSKWSLEEKQRQASAADLLAQVQQLGEERRGLIE
jgi:prephenate dehydratase